jgi:hypothetical protein
VAFYVKSENVDVDKKNVMEIDNINTVDCQKFCSVRSCNEVVTHYTTIIRTTPKWTAFVLRVKHLCTTRCVECVACWMSEQNPLAPVMFAHKSVHICMRKFA